jgi:hypothetical protein
MNSRGNPPDEAQQMIIKISNGVQKTGIHGLQLSFLQGFLSVGDGEQK